MAWWVLILVALGIACWVLAALGVAVRVHLGYLGAALVVAGWLLVPAINAV